MTLHQLLPVAACVLNVCLGFLALQRDGRSALNRVFAAFAAAMALWTFGVVMLRRAPDAATAFTWQVLIHAGVAFIPALYYHFVAVFLADRERGAAGRAFPARLPYVIGAAFMALSLTRNPAFLDGVQLLTWGWAPKPGVLYPVFVLWFNAVVVVGWWRLGIASRGFTVSFRRNRARLILLGTAVSLVGGAVDFLSFLLVRFFPGEHLVYPVGVIANMVFAVLMGTSIIRYRMFDVTVAARRFAVYVLAGGVGATVLALGMRDAAAALAEHGRAPLWLAVPGAALFALALSPVGRRAGQLLDEITYQRHRGCYDALLELSRHVGAVRAPERIAAMLTEGVATGVPVTHCALLTAGPASTTLTCTREHVLLAPGAGDGTLAVDGPVARWLLRTGQILVREGRRLDPALGTALAGGATELAGLRAALIVPLGFDDRLVGVLAIGEKLSGEPFDSQELSVLGVLAAQAALALDNARLLRESEQRLCRAEALNVELDSFVASASHDLKAPLVAIDGLSGLLLELEGENVSADGRRQLARIQMNVRRMEQLVADLLLMSRIGRETSPREAVDVEAVVDQVLETLDAAIRMRGIRVVRRPLGTAWGFAHDLCRVFNSLLANAVTYLGDAPDPTVEIGVDEVGDALEYWVKDNGIGIDPAYHDKVFEMYQRLCEVTAEGNGIGLPMVKKTVEAAGGRVWLESTKGRGTTVRFTWPRPAVVALS